MANEIDRIRRLPRTMRTPFKRESPELKAMNVIHDLLQLPPTEVSPDEIIEATQALLTKDTQSSSTPYFGRSTKEIDNTIRIILEKIQRGQINQSTGKKLIDALRDQRARSLEQPISMPKQLTEQVIDRSRLAMRSVGRQVTRRRLLIGGGILGVMGAAYPIIKTFEPLPAPKHDEENLNLQPKLQLTTNPTDASRTGVRLRLASEKVLYKLNNTYFLDNYFDFNYFGGDFIRIIALMIENKFTPFFRIYALDGSAKDYIIPTTLDENNDNVSGVIKMESIKYESVSHYTQFKFIRSGKSIQIIGNELLPTVNP